MQKERKADPSVFLYMEHKEHFIFGKVIKTIGYKGEFLLAFDVDSEEKYTDLKEILFESADGTLESFEVASLAMNKNHTAVILLKELSDLSGASAFVGKHAFLPLAHLPPLAGNAFYHHEVIGFSVYDSVRGHIGVVTGVTILPHQKLLEFEHNGKEVLLPVLPEFYLDIDRQARILLVNIPEGLLDVYSNPS